MERVIGQYVGSDKGTLLVVVGGIHGNELAGVKAITRLFELLYSKQLFVNGMVLGLRGNLQALQQQRRYLSADLNRCFSTSKIRRIKATPPNQLQAEDLEVYELLHLIYKNIEVYQPQKVVYLDLHTTTAKGAAFSIVANDVESLKVAMKMHVPIILDLLKGLSGTTLQYFNTRNLKVKTLAIGFEGGQHEEPAAVDRSLAAIFSCLKAVGMWHTLFGQEDEKLINALKDYSTGLPEIVQFRYVHKIKSEDQFRMQPGYKNFQKVRKGELLAQDRYGPIHAKESGLILMPWYQQQGSDGFFIIRAIEDVAY